MTSFNIREYRSEDYEKIFQIWIDTDVTNVKRGDTQQSVEETIKYGGKLFVLEVGNKIIGTSWITDDGRRLYLHHLAIDPRAQKNGWGQRLVLHSLDYAKKRNMQIKLEVHRENFNAVHIYKKMGFCSLGNYEVYILRDH